MSEKKPKVSKEERQARQVYRIGMATIRLEMSRLASGPPAREKIESLNSIGAQVKKMLAVVTAEVGDTE